MTGLVPPGRVILRRAGTTSGDTTHTARSRDCGSIREYIPTTSANTTVPDDDPARSTSIAAGALRKPSGSPTPPPMKNATSSYHASASGKLSDVNGYMDG